MCLPLQFFPPVAEVRPADPAEARIVAMAEERLAQWLASNAAKPVPDPVCRVCGMPHYEKDSHELIEGTCETCGGNIFENLAWDFIFARNKRARRKAAAALRALALEPDPES